MPITSKSYQTYIMYRGWKYSITNRQIALIMENISGKINVMYGILIGYEVLWLDKIKEKEKYVLMTYLVE